MCGGNVCIEVSGFTMHDVNVCCPSTRVTKFAPLAMLSVCCTCLLFAKDGRCGITSLLSTLPPLNVWFVCSYAMVLVEIDTQEYPWKHVTKQPFLTALLTEITLARRPALSDTCSPAFRNLADNCWRFQASDRFTFDEIVAHQCFADAGLTPNNEMINTN
eukprot:m.141752 g.141752  ORF g.141752 m.141752 type:complete len:160 (+) comp17125_c1_seq6:2697-3176(+)